MLRKLFIIAVILLSAQACKSNTLSVIVQFDAVSGLTRQDRVVFEQNTIGNVEDLHFKKDGRYDVRLLIDKGFANAVTEHSRFVIVDDPDRQGSKAVAVRLDRLGGAPLADGATVEGTSSFNDVARQLQKEMAAGFDFFQKQIEQFSQDLKQVPDSEAYQRIKKALSDLADEMVRAEKKTREKLKQDWLPRIESEIEAFKKQLEDLDREKEAEPLEKELERLRKI